MKPVYILLALILLIGCMSRTENIAQSDIQTKDLAKGLRTVWSLAWGADDFIWMTERYGRVSRVNPGSGEVLPLITITDVYETGEGGLMGLALDPDFSVKPYVYLSYNYHSGSGTAVKVVKYTYDGTTLKDPQTLIQGIAGNTFHDGCRLWIDSGMLFITTGDAGNQSLPQDLSSVNGKVLRLNLDGSIPPDNPFPGSPVWTWGHRNAQGLYVAKGIMYSSEHGPDTDDEVNIIEKGRNYGWPVVRGFCNTESEIKFCQDSNVVQPIAAWTPTLAVSGLAYYDNDLIPQWKNSLLLNTLKASRLVQLKLSDDHRTVLTQTVYFDGTYGRLRGICVSPDGRVFIGTSNRDGRGDPADSDDRIIEISARETSANDKNDSGLNFSVFPNPADNNAINFNLPVMASGACELEIFDVWGRSVNKQFIANAGLLNGLIRFEGFILLGRNCLPGVYLALLRTGGSLYRCAFVLI